MEKSMFDKLEELEKKYNELTEKISDATVIANQDEWKKYMKEHSQMKEVVEKYIEYKKTNKSMNEAKELMHELEMKEIAEIEYLECKDKLVEIEDELKILLLPKDQNDDNNVIIEIRGGAGGEEAALFAYNLYRMYTMYADLKRWQVELLDMNETGIGGIKEVSFMIKGKGAYSKLKFESGVHRVQRVPETEASGRIHTSTVTVAVLPEVDDVEVEIKSDDLRIDTYRASGAGGQHVNKTESAIRITHLPTGFVVSCQTERSQLQNRETAMKMLRSKLYEYMEEQKNKELASTRKLQVGTGDRSEKIRTYNYPQGRVTDHRINYTMYQLENFMNGNLDDMIEALRTYDRAERLKEGTI
jgi:peptide chain release factor 1